MKNKTEASENQLYHDGELKTCENCAYRNGSVGMGRCLLSGNYCTIERSHPTTCKCDFSGWQPKPAKTIKNSVLSYPKCLFMAGLLLILISGIVADAFGSPARNIVETIIFIAFIVLFTSGIVAFRKVL